MAIHQYPLSFIPRAVLLKTCGRIPQQLLPVNWGEEWLPQDYDKVASGAFYYEPDFDWWQNTVIIKDLEAGFNAILPRTPETEYSTALLHFGSYDTHDANICLNERSGAIESAGFRLDLTKELRPLVEAILTLCRKLDLVLLGSHDEIIATGQALAAAIIKSRPNRFLQDPEGYLTQLHEDS